MYVSVVYNVMLVCLSDANKELGYYSLTYLFTYFSTGQHNYWDKTVHALIDLIFIHWGLYRAEENLNFVSTFVITFHSV